MVKEIERTYYWSVFIVMDIEGDFKKVKQLHKKLFIQVNLVFLLVAVFFVSYIVGKDYSFFVLLLLFSVMFWSIAANLMYSLKTGKTLGPKSLVYIQAYEKQSKGLEQWKQEKMTEFLVITFVSIVFTVGLFLVMGNAMRIDSATDLLPFLGGWLGANIGQIIRIYRL